MIKKNTTGNEFANKKGVSELSDILIAAKELIETGEYEAATSHLKAIWKGVGIMPEIESFSGIERAEALALCGSLTGWLGSTRQIDGSQESAKNMLWQSCSILEELGENDKWADVRSELAVCYWREGSFDEARVILQDALERISPSEFKLKGKLILRQVNTEISAHNYKLATLLLNKVGSIIESDRERSLHGKYYFHRALVLKKIAEEENRIEGLEESLNCYNKAKFFYEKANHFRFAAMTENNLGCLLCLLERYDESHKHLDRALNYYTSINDEGDAALVYDSKAQTYLNAGNIDAAEDSARTSVRLLSNGDEKSALVNSLITLGRILSRKGNVHEACKIFENASGQALMQGDNENAGLALLYLIEETGDALSFDAKREIYIKVSEILVNSPNTIIFHKLKTVTGRFIGNEADSLSHKKEPQSETEFLGKSGKIREIISYARNIASSRLPLLISGESGTGKTALARKIHEWSRINGNLRIIDCNLFENSSSQRFFPSYGFLPSLSNSLDLIQTKVSFKGTLLFKHIEKLNLYDQTFLSNLLENESSDLRVIGSTNLPHDELIADPSFSTNLFYKINKFSVWLPPLRERNEDIEVLAVHFVQVFSQKFSKSFSIHDSFYKLLSNFDLFGNAHELKSIIEKVCYFSQDNCVLGAAQILDHFDLGKKGTGITWEKFSLVEEVNKYESKFVLSALLESNGKVTKAAELLGISHQTLSLILKQRHTYLAYLKKPRKPRTRKPE